MADMIAAMLVATVSISHEPVTCLVKDRFALVEATLEPAAEVATARVYFKAAEATDYYAVDMALTLGTLNRAGRFSAKLPKAKEKAGAVTYFIEVVSADGTNRKTPEIRAEVVRRREDCPEGALLAAEADKGDVKVLATIAGQAKPREFSGISHIVAPASAAGSEPPSSGEAAAETPAGPPSPVPPATAQPQPAPSGVPQAPQPVPPGALLEEPDDGYAIGPGDILKITVFGHEDLTQTVIVQSDGNFFYTLVGRVKASDMTPKELERKLTTLLAQGYIRNPQITVMVQEYRSKSIFVMGEVARPGPLPYSGNMTVMEMLAKVGPTAGAGSEVMILRPKRGTPEGPAIPGQDGSAASGNPNVETIRINFRDIQMGQLEKNILLKPNDTVFVTQAPKVFVLGEVRNPGPQSHTPGLTVRQAIVQAGGFTSDAARGKIRIGRTVEGEYKELKAKLDDPLEPGDTVTVKAKWF
jgi:polysaccharide export outer membrane protein